MPLRNLFLLSVVLSLPLFIRIGGASTNASSAPEGVCEWAAPEEVKKCENAFACAIAWCKHIATERKDKKLLLGVDGDFKHIVGAFRTEKSVREWLVANLNIREPLDTDVTQFLVTLWVMWKVDKSIEPKDFAVALKDHTLVRFESDPDKALLSINGNHRGTTPAQTFLSTKIKTKYEVSLTGYLARVNEDYTASVGDIIKVMLKKQ